MSHDAKANRIFFYGLTLFTFILGLSFILYRHYVSFQPWVPSQKSEVWSIEAHIKFEGEGKPVQLSLALPKDQAGFRIKNQSTASSGFGLDYIDNPSGASYAKWSKREAKGPQSLYYSVEIEGISNFKPQDAGVIPFVTPVNWEEPFKTAALSLIEQSYSESFDNFSFTQRLYQKILFEKETNQNVALLLKEFNPIDLMIHLLAEQKIASVATEAIQLEDGRRKQNSFEVLKVYNPQGEFAYFDPETGEKGLEKNIFIWNSSGSSLFDLLGGKSSSIQFSMLKQSLPITKSLSGFEKNPSLIDFSIYALPIEEQSMFKVILLIPLGVFIVVIMRVLFGLRTSGTFMPVLLALSFIETNLVTGLLGFLLIVGTGLIIRSYLSRLNLLLVARISAVIITVIIIIAAFTVISYKIGLTEGLKITYFPIIILAWTIERMSVLWEEEGPKEVSIQGGSSLFVSVLIYLVIQEPHIRYLIFNFIGFQFILLSLILLLGNYTGYRLSELFRFTPFLNREKEDQTESSL